MGRLLDGEENGVGSAAQWLKTLTAQTHKD